MLDEEANIPEVLYLHGKPVCRCGGEYNPKGI
jgi:hypothetical protein